MPLLLFLAISGLFITGYALNTMNGTALRLEQDKKTFAALKEAKTALIGWSAMQVNRPGTLPCTNTNAVNDGLATNAGQNCNAYIGRLPWRTLGIGDVRDGHGECLWYALSPIYRFPISEINRGGANTINSNVPGTITILEPDGTPFPNPVIAVIFSVGEPINGQNRTGAGGGICGGNFNPTNYLDIFNGINNATGNLAGNNYTFTKGEQVGVINDKLIVITAQELYLPVRKRIVSEIMGSTNTSDGLFDAYEDSAPLSEYPCPANPATPNGPPQDCTIMPLPVTGRANNEPAGMALQYSVLGAWLQNNNWFGIADYEYTDPANVRLGITDPLGTYTCVASANVVTCS